MRQHPHIDPIDDAVLVRWLDGQASPDERARVDALKPAAPAAHRLRDRAQLTIERSMNVSSQGGTS